MRRTLFSLVALLACCGSAHAQGLLVPKDTKLPPLAMLNHNVKVTLEDQVAITSVEQTFHNHTDRELEATYVFPVPKGASVRKFSMWVNGKEEKGELIEAAKARQIYTDIVRRTLDPGLLEYVGNDVLRVRVFPVPARGDQKIAFSFTSVAPMEGGMVEYTYPLKIETAASRTIAKFSLELKLKSQHPIQNIYSPTHAIALVRPNDKEATIVFEKDQALVNKDFQLYYSSATKDVGLTALLHRPIGEMGYFLMLISPRSELSKAQEVPRDMIFVLDTSGSMRGKRIEQARKALKFCLDRLDDKDRFSIIHFASIVAKYTENLKDANVVNRADARKWVDALEADGGTNINDALAAALQMRTADASRPFTVVFFTDGQPTVGEVNPDRILNNVMAKNTAGTRIFTFGVGDDVNAALLDQLSDKTRAVATYVRETEDIEAKVSGLYAKISNPVLTDLKLSVGAGVTLSEVYPPQLPDLFHGTQLVVLGRYKGQGTVQVKLTGQVGKEPREFVHELNFAEQTGSDKGFVEDLWARRKVGFLLDLIRLNGESKELKDEVVFLAKRYGITTPYTSYLVVPAGVNAGFDTRGMKLNAPPGLGGTGGLGGAGGGGGAGGIGDPGGIAGGKGKAAGAGKKGGGGAKGGAIPLTPVPPAKVEDLAKQLGGDQKKADELRDKLANDALKEAAQRGDKDAKGQLSNQSTFDRAKFALDGKILSGVQEGKLGVDLSVQVNNLRNQQQVAASSVQRVANRNLVDIGGVWIDDGFDAKMKIVTIKAQSEAYFRVLERQPGLRDLLRLGNHLVYVTPSGDALIIDAEHGVDTLPDAEIDRLFVAAKKK